MKVKKILVVDDQPMLREFIEVVIRDEGRKVLQAESGERALEIARLEKPDLILMDIMMPGGMDGLEVTRILKNDPLTRNCAIVAVTAKVQRGDRLDALAAGVDGYLAKPFTLAQLRKKVGKFLN
ncbi:MAG: response regulator [Desulfuromonadales bacterium]